VPDAQGIPTWEELKARHDASRASVVPDTSASPPPAPPAPAPAAPPPPAVPQRVGPNAKEFASTAREGAAAKLAQVFQKFGPWTAHREPGFTQMPANAAKGVLSIGPALSSAVGAVVRGVPTLAKAAGLGTDAAGQFQAQQELGGTALAVGRQLTKDAIESVKHPLRTVQEYPFEVATAANAAGKVAAKAALAAVDAAPAGAAGATALPSMVSKLKPALEAAAETGPAKPAAQAADAALRRAVPPYGEMRATMDANQATDRVLAAADQAELLSRNRDYKVFWNQFGGLTDAQHDQFVQYMSGLHPTTEPIDHETFKAVEAWRRLPAQVQNEWMRMGKLTPEAGEWRARQPQRIEEFGTRFGEESVRRVEAAAAEKAVSDHEIDDFVKAVGASGGDAGPIAPDRLRSIGRYLKGMKGDPRSMDPMKVAKEIFEREAPRLAEQGKFPRRYVGDWEKTLRRAKKGTYQNATAPLLHQIEGIVKGSMQGVEVPPIAGALPAAEEPGAAVGAEVRRLFEAKRGGLLIRKTLRNHAERDLFKRVGGDPKDAAARVEAMLAGKEEIPADWLRDIARENPEFRRAIGGVIERNLQRARAAQRQTPMPNLDQLPAPPLARKGWQMTRDEWDALPENVRKRKAGGLPEDLPPEQWYDHMIERAIEKKRAVPREVLKQNEDWFDRALTPANLRLKQTTDEVAAAMAARGVSEPMYFPFIREPVVMQWRNIFSRMMRGQRFKPRSLRQSFGQTYAEGEFVKDPKILAARVTDDLRKYQKAEAVIQGVLKDPAIPKRILKPGEQPLPGEIAWSPDGLRLWRRNIEFGEKFLGEMERFGVSEDGAARSLGEAIKAGIGEGAWTASESGFGKGRVYAIPASVGKKLAAAYTEAPAWVRNLYDPLSGAWRFSVLALRPAWVFNNILGNIVFSTLEGVAPRHYLMALTKQFQAKTPDELNGIGLTAQESDAFRMVGAESRGPLGEFFDWLGSKPSSAPAEFNTAGDVARGVGTALDPRRIGNLLSRFGDAMRTFNNNVEDFYRRAAFMKEAEKITSKKYLLRTGNSFFKAYSLLDELDTMQPQDVKLAVARVNAFQNDYSALSPMQRAYVRRVVPFWSFLKHQLRLLTGLPMDYPGRATMLQGLVQVGREAQAYDNTILPDYLRDRGLVFTGYTVDVPQADGTTRPMHAFVSTSGTNPLVIGYNPGGGAEPIGGDVPGATSFFYSQSSPLVKYPLLGLHRGYDPQSGRALTKKGITEKNGHFYELQDGHPVEVSAPMPNMAEYYAGNMPIVQLARRMIEPRAGYTASPLSTDPSRQFANRTRALEVLRYFTPTSIILVDARDLRRPVLPPRQTIEILLQLARQKRMDSEQPAREGRAP